MKAEPIHKVFRNILGETVSAWYVDGMFHKEDGPALIVGESKGYFRHGAKHRVNGPAEIYGNTKYLPQWYLHGVNWH